ncbi:CPBP family intramembrane glutamic endopeptidase [Convivina intestini]|nr:CPBP family intramembrane glutamic endopeptidase [Convivina intestini]
MERIAGGLMGGVPEELFCRGVLLGAFLTYVIKYDYTYKKLILSIVSSSAIFGLLHFTNLTHAPFPLTVMQVIISILGGLTFAFIYVQTGSIWYAVAVHFTNNFLRAPNTGIDSSIQTAALAIFGYFTILVVVYFLWYDRKHTPQLVKNIKQSLN